MAAVFEHSLTGVSALASTPITFGFTAAAGRVLILTVAADDYSSTPPSGWTLANKQETYLGHYVFYKIAGGSETSVTYTIGSAAKSNWNLYEIGGLSSFDLASGNQSTSTTSAWTSSPITPTSGDKLIFVSFAGSNSTATAITGLTGVTTGYGQSANGFTSSASPQEWTDNYSIVLTATGSTAYDAGYTSMTGTSTQRATAIMLAFSVASGVTPEAKSGTGAITAAGSLTSAGKKAALGVAVMSATAVLTASGVASIPSASGTGSITASASVTSTGQKNAVGNGELIFYGMLSGSGTGSIIASKTGAGSINATAALTSAGKKATNGTASITATPTLTGSGYGGETQASSGTGGITAAYALIATGSKSTSGTGSISATAALTGHGGNAENLRDISLTAVLESAGVTGSLAPNRITATLERA